MWINPRHATLVLVVTASYGLGGRDVIVIGTGGIRETCNVAGDQFGTARIRDAVHAAIARPASEIMDEVVRWLNEYRCIPGARTT